MKNVSFLFLVCALLLAQTSIAQRIARDFSPCKDLIIEMRDAKISIIGNKGDKLIVEMESPYKLPERAKGLRLVSPGAIENTGIGLEIKQMGKEMQIRKIIEGKYHYKITVPSCTALQISVVTDRRSKYDLTVKNISKEIEIESKGVNVNISDVRGPLVINTRNANVTASFSALNPARPSYISTVFGFIDIALPDNAKADFRLKARGGDVYTDLAFELVEKAPSSAGKNRSAIPREIPRNGPVHLDTLAHKRHSPHFGKEEIVSRLNGGGVEITLKSVERDIYVRKKK